MSKELSIRAISMSKTGGLVFVHILAALLCIADALRMHDPQKRKSPSEKGLRLGGFLKAIALVCPVRMGASRDCKPRVPPLKIATGRLRPQSQQKPTLRSRMTVRVLFDACTEE